MKLWCDKSKIYAKPIMHTSWSPLKPMVNTWHHKLFDQMFRGNKSQSINFLMRYIQRNKIIKIFCIQSML
jgi:hypothetical protein